MHRIISCFLVASQITASLANAVNRQGRELEKFEDISRRYTKRTAGGLHVPIVTTRNSKTLERRADVSRIGLGDYVDIAYSVLITVGGVTTPLVLDTGSSDLWIMSDTCLLGCAGGPRLYPQASFNYSGVDVALLYGDSTTGTFAKGTIGDDLVDLAGISLQHQYFGAINATNTSLGETGSAGIFGLGFPINSAIWNNLYDVTVKEVEAGKASLYERRDEVPIHKPGLKLGSPFPNLHFRTAMFPSFPGRLSRTSSSSLFPSTPIARKREPTSSEMYHVFKSYSTIGPFLPRLVELGMLSRPMFSITLQRDTIDIGGNMGMLSLGELPNGVKDANMTWVPLRLYTEEEGNLPAPPNAPKEVYPITWEVMMEGVYFDGELLPQSNLYSSSIKLSALMDTGNSAIRGPADTVAMILDKLGPDGIFPCTEPHTLTFKIGGKMFPVDPRDFAGQAYQNNVQFCTPNLVATDPPAIGGYQFSWSLGSPFLKGVLSSYYFGNLTYPTHDPPKMGFLSTVPKDAGDKMVSAVVAAANVDDNFPVISETAPSGTVSFASSNSNGIPQATNAGFSDGRGSSRSGASGGLLASGVSWSPLYAMLLLSIVSSLSWPPVL
ncbi:hypothetical protein D9613_012568 [Agrocybe pediades]|uniref:Peptidase A1 domain-containing protein n=1 Tax=Agrocybe pediades TaxID=84607 RepID=A0A8H4R1H3_9AGAR|nr:hypothetical protein D9613_012568 [Agrocybe pediades]